MHRRLVTLAVLSCLAGGNAAAQASVRGTVMDSLRSAPLAGAVVSIEGGGARTRTDARGRYELPDVPAGNHTIVVQSPYLDSMALGALRAEVRVQTRAQELHFATPSRAAYHRAVCGTVLPPEQGVLVGTVLAGDGEPILGMPVSAIWTETVITPAGVDGVMRGTSDSTDASGFFTLCGVPLDATYRMRAGDDGIGSAVLSIAASNGAVRRRDVLVGAATPTVRLRGRLVSAAGAPLEGTVELLGDTGSVVRTDASGAFELHVAARSEQLWTRVIGYTPRTLELEYTTTEIDLGDVRHVAVPHELEGRIIDGRVVSREEFAFEERRKAGFGVFFDSTELARFPRVTAGALASRNTLIRPGARRSMVATTGEIVMLRSNNIRSALAGACYPRIYVNGVAIGNQDENERMAIPADYLGDLLRMARRIEVYKAQFAPAEFVDPDGCGALVIWTR